MNKVPHVIINENSTVTLLAIEKITESILPNSQFHIETESMTGIVRKIEDVAANLLFTDLSCCPDSNDAFMMMLFKLCQQQPQLKVIIYSDPIRGFAMNMLSRLRQVVFLSRRSSLKEFQVAVTTILSGINLFDNKIMLLENDSFGEVIGKLHLLTHCERNVIAHVLHGDSLSDISSLLQRSIKTVSAHKCNAMRKLEARNVAELFLIKSEFFSALSRYSCPMMQN